jgi:hypothetical protein
MADVSVVTRPSPAEEMALLPKLAWLLVVPSKLETAASSARMLRSPNWPRSIG